MDKGLYSTNCLELIISQYTFNKPFVRHRNHLVDVPRRSQKEDYKSQRAHFRLGRVTANQKRPGFMAALRGAGPTRLASSKCHDFTADHGSSSGARGTASGERKEEGGKKRRS